MKRSTKIPKIIREMTASWNVSILLFDTRRSCPFRIVGSSIFNISNNCRSMEVFVHLIRSITFEQNIITNLPERWRVPLYPKSKNSHRWTLWYKKGARCARFKYTYGILSPYRWILFVTGFRLYVYQYAWSLRPEDIGKTRLFPEKNTWERGGCPIYGHMIYGLKQLGHSLWGWIF